MFCMKTAYDQYDVNTATVLYQSFYVYNNRPGLRIGTYSLRLFDIL